MVGPATRFLWLRRLLISLVLIALVIAGGLFVAGMLASLRRDPQRRVAAPPLAVVSVVRAERRSDRDRLTGYGAVRALRDARVSAQVAGVVTTVAELQPGSGVSVGTVLVELDDRDFRQAVVAATAERARVTAVLAREEAIVDKIGEELELNRRQLEASRRELARIEGLVASGTAAASDLDRQRLSTVLLERAVVTSKWDRVAAERGVDRARAELQAAENAVDSAELDLARCVVRAPLEGTISERLISPGTYVSPGTALFEIVDLGRVEVAISLPAARRDEIGPGTAVRLSSTSRPGDGWTGQIDRLGAVVDELDRTFFAYSTIETGTGIAPVPGDFLLAELEGRVHESVFVIPRVAFVEGKIFVLEREGEGEAATITARERAVEVSRYFPDVALVESGIEPGEEIVVTNLEEIANGTRVRIATTDANGARR